MAFMVQFVLCILIIMWGGSAEAQISQAFGGVFSLLPVDQLPDRLPELSNPDVAGLACAFY